MPTQASTGMRFFTSGVELVRKTFDELGQSGQKMWAGIASGQTKASPAMRGLNQASKELQDGIGGIAANAGSAGAVLLQMGPAGVAAAAGVGAVVVAFREAKKSVEAFGAIGESADRIIKGDTDALQKWRYVVEQTGGTIQDADSALASFSEKFGGARAGNQKSLKLFEALGFTQDDLKKFETAGQLLPEVTSRIAGLKSQDEQLFITGKLGIQAFLPAIREGQGAIDTMMRDAQASGLIVEKEMIERAKSAGDEYKKLSSIIDTNLNKAFVDLAPALLAIVGLLADGAKHLNVFANAMKSVPDRESAFLARDNIALTNQRSALLDRWGDKVTKYSTDPSSVGNLVDNLSGLNAARQEYEKVNGALKENTAELEKRAKAAGGTGWTVNLDGNGDVIDFAFTGGKIKPPSTPGKNPLGPYLKEMGPDEKLGQDDRYNEAMRRAREKYLSALEREVISIDQRLELELQGLQNEKEARAKELAEQVKRKGLTQAQADEIAAAEQKARDAKEEQLSGRARREKQRIAQQYESDMADMTLELLKVQEDMEVTVQGRYKIQREILDAERAQARKALEFSLAQNQNLSDSQKRDELERFDKVTEAQRRQLSDAQSGTRQMFRDAFHDGISEAIRNKNPFALLTGFFESLADRFAQRLEDRLADEAFDALDQLMSSNKSGSGSTGGGSSWGSIADGVIGLFGAGHAAGGPTRAGVMYPVAERGFEIFSSGRDGYVLNHNDSVASIAAEVGRMISPTVTVATPAPTIELHNHGEPLEVDSESYDPATNRKRIDFGRGASGVLSKSITDGGVDKAMQSRYGLGPRLKRRT